MIRSLQGLVSLALLVVLSGAPFAAVLCAEWCLEAAHQGHTASAGPAGAECHDGAPPASGVLSAAPESPCTDHDGAVVSPSSLAAGGRTDVVLASIGAVAAVSPLPPRPSASLKLVASLFLVTHGPASSHRVLRI